MILINMSAKCVGTLIKIDEKLGDSEKIPAELARDFGDSAGSVCYDLGRKTASAPTRRPYLLFRSKFSFLPSGGTVQASFESRLYLLGSNSPGRFGISPPALSSALFFR